MRIQDTCTAIIVLSFSTHVNGYKAIHQRSSWKNTKIIHQHVTSAKFPDKNRIFLASRDVDINSISTITNIAPDVSIVSKESLKESAVQTIPPVDNKGYIVLVLLFLVTALCALDRVAMSVAIRPMGAEFQYSESTRGLISSIFSLGYMVGLVPSGLLGTFSSPKRILSYGVLLWSLAQIATPFAAYTNIQVLLASRFFMGLAEAVAIPTVQTFVARWVPENQRSIGLGLVLSGLQVPLSYTSIYSPPPTYGLFLLSIFPTRFFDLNYLDCTVN
jgi:Na+/melibiose symporter-like transporter